MYRFDPAHSLALSPYVGCRWWTVSSDVELHGGTLNGFEKDFDRAWADAVAGLYVRNDISERWFVESLGDVGAGASRLTWQVYGATGYSFNDWFGLSLGYRFVGVDYDRDDFVFDVVTSGFLLGLRFTF